MRSELNVEEVINDRSLKVNGLGAVKHIQTYFWAIHLKWMSHIATKSQYNMTFESRDDSGWTLFPLLFSIHLIDFALALCILPIQVFNERCRTHYTPPKVNWLEGLEKGSVSCPPRSEVLPARRATRNRARPAPPLYQPLHAIHITALWTPLLPIHRADWTVTIVLTERLPLPRHGGRFTSVFPCLKAIVLIIDLFYINA